MYFLKIRNDNAVSRVDPDLEMTFNTTSFENHRLWAFSGRLSYHLNKTRSYDGLQIKFRARWTRTWFQCVNDCLSSQIGPTYTANNKHIYRVMYGFT